MTLERCQKVLEFQGYAYQEVFTARERAFYKKACELVACVPYEWDGSPVRCHELVRAVARFTDLTYTDGYYGMCEHSWLWLKPLEELSSLPRILDVYTPGRIPQVQLVDPSTHLPFEYRRGPPRDDIKDYMVTELAHMMRESRKALKPSGV